MHGAGASRSTDSWAAHLDPHIAAAHVFTTVAVVSPPAPSNSVMVARLQAQHLHMAGRTRRQVEQRRQSTAAAGSGNAAWKLLLF
jgi:hypothetical protein